MWIVLWSPLRCTLTTPEVSTTNAETGHPLASQASIAVVAASRARASGRSYPDYATCAAAEDGRVIEAHALKVNATVTDFIMLVSLGDGVRLVSRFEGKPDMPQTCCNVCFSCCGRRPLCGIEVL